MNSQLDADGIPKYRYKKGYHCPVSTPASVRALVKQWNTDIAPIKHAIAHVTQTPLRDLKPNAFQVIEQIDRLMKHWNTFSEKVEREMEVLGKQGNGSDLSNGFVALDAKKENIDLMLYLLVTKLVRAYKSEKSVAIKEDFRVLIEKEAPRLLETIQALRKTRDAEYMSKAKKIMLHKLELQVNEIRHPHTPRASL